MSETAIIIYCPICRCSHAPGKHVPRPWLPGLAMALLLMLALAACATKPGKYAIPTTAEPEPEKWVCEWNDKFELTVCTAIEKLESEGW